jgi:hypothetical protein
MKYLVVTLALSTFLFQGCAKKDGGKANLQSPGAKATPAAGTGVPKGTPPPPAKTNNVTVLEGTWATSGNDGIRRTITVKNDSMSYLVENMSDAEDVSQEQFYISVVAKTSPKGSMTHEVTYYDEEGYFLFTEVFAIDSTPAPNGSVRIGPSDDEWQRYYKQ